MQIAENIDKKLNQHSQQSLLWIHGGHPILPASAELFKQQQLFIELCESVWPTKANPYNQGMAYCYSDSYITIMFNWFYSSSCPFFICLCLMCVKLFMVGDDCLVEMATSSTPELRFLAVQGRAFTLFLWGVYFVDKNFHENDWAGMCDSSSSVDF